nr:reverse transcriptase domain-containing protein [Tanacetum cinerariifolium]
MRTRSKSYPNNSNATVPRRVPNIVEPEIRTIEEVVPMADHTMEELLQAPTEGYREAIVIPKILAENFEIKTNLLQLVQTNKFHGFKRDNPHTHISNFKRMTSTLKYKDVPNVAIKLMLFPYSLERDARIELTQIDTFYNRLNEQDQDSLNAAAGRNLLSKTTREAFKIIENKSKVRYSRSKSNISRVNTNCRDSSSKTDDRIDKLADQISNLVEIVNKQVITPATAKAVEKTCVICGGAHAYYDCIATDSIQPSVCATTGTYNQVSSPNRASNQIPPPGFAPVQNNQISFFQNQASTSGTLPSNTVPNPKGEMKAVTTRSGLAYEGPSIPTNYPLEKVVERDTKEITDKEHSNCQGSDAHIQPPVVAISISKPDVSKTQPKPNIPYPSRLNDQKLREKATNQMEKKVSKHDPFQLPPMDLKQAEETKAKSSIEEPFKLELKELPSHLEYAFLEETDKLLVIIAKDLKDVEKEALIKVLKSHKWAIAWKISDIKGIDLIFYTHQILMEEDYKPAVQSQRRVNPKFHDVTKTDVIKLLDAGMMCLISDSPWVSPIHCVPKKGGMTVVANENNELIPTRLVIGWRVCIDYRKLNDATRKDHFSLPFMDQMLKRLAGNEFYFFRWIFRIFPNSNRSPRPRENNFHMPLWNFRLPSHVIWLV